MENLTLELLSALVHVGVLGGMLVALVFGCMLLDKLVMRTFRAARELAITAYRVVAHIERSALLHELEASEQVSEEGPYRSALRSLDLSSRITHELRNRYDSEEVAWTAISKLVFYGGILASIVVGVNWLTSANVFSGIGNTVLTMAVIGRFQWHMARIFLRSM